MIDVSRRQLLQFFGIGTTIAPVGASVTAKLLAVPQVELVQATEFPNGHSPTLFADRLKWNPYEAIWLYMWQIENNPDACVNYGIGPLEHLLGHAPTEAEKSAAAGIMQWFGTNCGHGFIEEALKVSGYRVQYDPSAEADAIRQLQHLNIWREMKGAPDKIEIRYRGRRITLERGGPGGVK